MNKEQFEEWISLPVTVEIFKEVSATKKNLVDLLANGQTIGGSVDETAMASVKIVGQIQGLSQLLNISYEEKE